jgi:hypothetical protein
VAAILDPARVEELVTAYQALEAEPVPNGLLASVLLKGDNGQWQIATLWRDRAALDAVRTAPEPPAAPQVFRQVGAQPTLSVLEVAAAIQPRP